MTGSSSDPSVSGPGSETSGDEASAEEASGLEDSVSDASGSEMSRLPLSLPAGRTVTDIGADASLYDTKTVSSLSFRMTGCTL